MRFLIKPVLAAVALVTMCPTTAFSADGIVSKSGDGSDSYIVASVQYGRPPSGKGQKDSSNCIWLPAGEASTTQEATVDLRVVNGVEQRLFIRSCPTTLTQFWVTQASGSSLAAAATDRVTERLPKPTLGSAPASNTGVVNVDMWLWTDPADYAPVSITAWVPTATGIAWTTTTATPVRLVYTPGEPGSTPIVCAGPGQAWQTGFADDAASDCMYAYRHSSEISASGTFPAQFSIVWQISWRSNVAIGANLGEYVTTTDTAVTVKEIQAVIVG